MESHSCAHEANDRGCGNTGPCQHESEEEAERQEREALGRIVFAFREYLRDATSEIARWKHNYNMLSKPHKHLLTSQLTKIEQAQQCAHINYFLIQSMLMAMDPDSDTGPVPDYLASAADAGDATAATQKRAPPVDTDKVRYVLKNLWRDWSAEGAAERQQSYGRILDELKRVFADRPNNQAPPRVLVPGAGLARLCCEVASLGYEAQGNEFSYFMLLTSSFILNHVATSNQFTIHPWMHTNCNQLSDEEQLRPVTVPDMHPADMVPRAGLLSMCAGDFVEVYSSPDMAGAFDSVVTCFFIDTAHNVVEYLEVIRHCLKPGGVWINLGPLLYHWAEGVGQDELSVELSLSDIRRLATSMGFSMQREEMVEAPYMANPRSMYKTVYTACFWTMTKEMAPPPPPPPPPRGAPPTSQ